MKIRVFLAVTVAMASALLSYADDLGQNGVPSNEASFALTPDGPPRFESTTIESILLRYKFASGQKVDMDMDVDMNMTMDLAGKTVKIPIVMHFEAEYVVQSVEANGDASVVMMFRRISMKAEGPSNVSFDSDKDANTSDPNLRPLAAMVNIPIPARVSALGKVLDMDLVLLNKAVERAQAAAMQSLEQTTDQLTRGSFIQLSEQPVKVGDTYDAGSIVQKLQDVGEMHANIRYKILSVSADKKQALLQPIGTFAMEASPSSDVDVSLESSEIDGWILFDLEWGNIRRSFVTSHVALSISQGQQTMRMKTHTVVRYNARGDLHIVASKVSQQEVVRASDPVAAATRALKDALTPQALNTPKKVSFVASAISNPPEDVSAAINSWGQVLVRLTGKKAVYGDILPLLCAIAGFDDPSPRLRLASGYLWRLNGLNQDMIRRWQAAFEQAAGKRPTATEAAVRIVLYEEIYADGPPLMEPLPKDLPANEVADAVNAMAWKAPAARFDAYVRRLNSIPGKRMVEIAGHYNDNVVYLMNHVLPVDLFFPDSSFDVGLFQAAYNKVKAEENQEVVAQGDDKQTVDISVSSEQTTEPVVRKHQRVPPIEGAALSLFAADETSKTWPLTKCAPVADYNGQRPAAGTKFVKLHFDSGGTILDMSFQDQNKQPLQRIASSVNVEGTWMIVQIDSTTTHIHYKLSRGRL